jgi:methylenetetrahydrofolate reductase (NADPH)
MKISDLFGQGRPLFSFEFFPPKTDVGTENLQRTLSELVDLAPDFVSITYGAGGSARDRTVELAIRIQRHHGLRTMAHLTCIASSRAEVTALVDRLVDEGIENLIPLRGDPPAGVEGFVSPPDAFAYASDLVAFIRQRHGQRLCLAGAGYPERHPQAVDLATDMQNLVTKVRAGVDFIVTQLFFDNRVYFDFVARARAAGITVPIIPGIMPITDVAQIQRMTQMCGTTVPAVLRAEMERRRSDPAAVAQLGVAQATAQCVDLLLGGAPGIHFYTLNQSPATRMIMTALKVRLG